MTMAPGMQPGSVTPMLAFVRRFRWLRWLLGGTVAAAVAWACSLNPQPLPPGDQGADASASPSADAGATTGEVGDTGAVFNGSEAGRSPPDGSTPPGTPGADGSTDAESDTGDSASDAPADASTDAMITDDGTMEGG